jgi:hypothetical protein
MNAGWWVAAITVWAAIIGAAALWLARRMHGNRRCRCGDPHAVHLHYTKRHKRYCGMCDCPKYKPVSWDQWIRELTHG